MSFVKTLSEKGNPIDYRPATHHSLFKVDALFDFRYGAIRHCYGSIDRYAQQVFWSSHKALTDDVVRSIKEHSSKDRLHFTSVVTGLSDGDRALVVRTMSKKVDSAVRGLVADVPCHRGQTCTELVQTICETLSMKFVDRTALYKSKTAPALAVGSDTISDTPLKALAQLLTYATDRQAGSGEAHLVVFLRHCEALDIHVLDNLIVQLCGGELDCSLHVVAFTDIMCQLPVQLSPTAQALISTRVLATVSPWDLYETICSRLFSARDIPLVFTPPLVAAIRQAFEESDLCVSTAIHRFKLCLAHHFQARPSLLAMYRETAWLQGMNILSKSETQFDVAKQRKGSVLRRSASVSGTSLASSLPLSVSGSSTVGEKGRRSLEDEEEGEGEPDAEEEDNDTIASEDAGTLVTSSSWAVEGAIGTESSLAGADPAIKSLSTEAARRQARHRLGAEAVLRLLEPEDLEATGLSGSDESVVTALENCELRAKVDYIWYGCLKMLRDGLLPIDDRPGFGSDLLWTDIHRSSYTVKPSSVSSSTATPFAPDTSTSIERARTCNQLVYSIRQGAAQLPALAVQDTVGQILRFLRNRVADVSAEESADYAEFVEALLNGIEQIDETLGFFVESSDGTAISLKYSLNKMRQVFARKADSTVANGDKSTKAAVVQVDLRDRKILNPDGSPPEDDPAGDGADADESAPLDETARVYALDMVTIFSEALTDFLDWVATSAMRHSALPSPLRVMEGEVEGAVKVNLRGVLQFSAVAEQRALAEMNDNLHATFVSPWKDPSSVFPPNMFAAEAGDRAPVRKFQPDGAILYKLLKSCQQRDTADSWFQKFAAAAEQQAKEAEQAQGLGQSKGRAPGKGKKTTSGFGWDLTAAAEATTAAGRKRKAKQAPLDERTVLKARFAGALHEMERAGLVACSTATAGAAAGVAAVTIDRKIYTWV